MLRHAQDAEDACQAAFLVLARKAGSIRKRDSLASWLHGVAYRVAADLRRDFARRRAREGSAADRPQRDTTEDVTWREVRAALDEELGRLPEQYRAPLVLCYLEGKTRDEAAGQLGWSPGALRGRLERGRLLVRAWLARRGLTLSAALLGTALAEGAAPAAVPAALAVATTRAAVLAAAGQTTAGVVAAPVAALTEGALKAMLLTKIKIVTAVLLGLALVSVGAVGLTRSPLAAEQPGAPGRAEPLLPAQAGGEEGGPKEEDREKEPQRLRAQLNKALEEKAALAAKMLELAAEKAALVEEMQAQQATLHKKVAALEDQLARERQGTDALRKELHQKETGRILPLAADQARDEVEVREALLEVQRAAVAEAATRLEPAKRRLERLTQLGKQASVSQEEVEQARSQVESLAAQLKVKQAELRVAEVQLQQARQRLRRLQDKKPGE